MKSVKLLIINLAPLYILALVLWILMIAGSMIIMILVNIIAGACILSVLLVILLIVCHSICIFVKIAEDDICQLSALGECKKRKKLADLKKIQILTLPVNCGKAEYVGKFFVLYFSEEINDFVNGDEAIADENVIIFQRTAKSEQVLKKFTSMPFEDKS